MGTQLNPYISFNGDAREALAFYESIFGGTLRTNTYGEYGQEGEAADQLMHGHLETEGGLVLMVADVPPGEGTRSGENIAISLSGEDEAELRGYWDGLSEGADVTVPLEPQMWGDIFGQLVDRFGIAWMVNINKPEG